MEYVDLALERIKSLDRERKGILLAAEAKRLGASRPWSMVAAFDGMLIRMGKGATRRQARRKFAANGRTLVS